MDRSLACGNNVDTTWLVFYILYISDFAIFANNLFDSVNGNEVQCTAAAAVSV